MVEVTKSNIFLKTPHWAASAKVNEQLQHSFSNYWNQQKSHRVPWSDRQQWHAWNTSRDNGRASRHLFHLPSSGRYHKHYIRVLNSKNLHDCLYTDEWEFVRHLDVFDALWWTSDVGSQVHLCSKPCFFLFCYILKSLPDNTPPLLFLLIFIHI